MFLSDVEPRLGPHTSSKIHEHWKALQLHIYFILDSFKRGIRERIYIVVYRK